MEVKEGLFGLKFITLGILFCLIIAGSVSLFLTGDDATGQKNVVNGILYVNGGDVLPIMTSTYQVKGIDVDTNGKLTFKNTTVKIQMDLGPDGSPGGGDDHT